MHRVGTQAPTLELRARKRPREVSAQLCFKKVRNQRHKILPYNLYRAPKLFLICSRTAADQLPLVDLNLMPTAKARKYLFNFSLRP